MPLLILAGASSNMKINQAIGYIRQSTSKQESLEWQQDVIQQEVGKRNHQLERVFYDKGSGKNLNRTGLELLRKPSQPKNLISCTSGGWIGSAEMFLTCWSSMISAANAV